MKISIILSLALLASSAVALDPEQVSATAPWLKATTSTVQVPGPTETASAGKSEATPTGAGAMVLGSGWCSGNPLC